MSLRMRFTLACVLIVLACTAAYGVAVYVEQEHVEDDLLQELMEREVAEFARMYHRDRTQPPPRSAQLRSYIVDPNDLDSLPPELQAVPPGIHHDVVIGGRNFQVANFTLEDKRFYLIYDITQAEEREALLEVVLSLGVLGATVLAWLIGWRASRVVTAPVTRLAADIRQLDAEHAPPEFGSRFAGSELADIAQAFDAYVRRLAEFVNRERTFTEDASHELRTPISIINTAVERLQSEPGLPAGTVALIERIGRAGLRMQVATQALLFLAREAALESAQDGARLGQIVQEAVDAHLPQAKAKSISLTLELSGAETPLVPRGLAVIVVSNLLQNAIGNTDRGQVRLLLEVAQLRVQDSGCGIAEVDLPRVFERGFRGSNSAGAGGHGLGLHIVRRICDRLGWEIAASSPGGAGAVFTVDFRPKSNTP